MKKYLQNLCYALAGYNPYRKELDDLTERYATLERDHAKALAVLDGFEKQLNILDEKLADAEQELKAHGKEKEAFDEEKKGYQRLTENLRKRIEEKSDASA